MKKYQVLIQDRPYKTVESDFVSDILRQIGTDIQDGSVPNIDDTKPMSIKIIPVSLSNEEILI